MILKSTAKALQNICDNFYYCGVEISKDNFNVTEFADVCSKINDLKHQLYEEKNLEKARSNVEIIGTFFLCENEDLVCSVNKNKCFLGIYNKQNKDIVPITKDLLPYFTGNIMVDLAHQMNRIANLYFQGVVTASKTGYVTIITDRQKLTAFHNYRHHVEKMSNCFYHTYEVEFVNGYKDYIVSDEQLKDSLIER